MVGEVTKGERRGIGATEREVVSRPFLVRVGWARPVGMSAVLC